MIFTAQQHAERDADLLEAAAAQMMSPSSSMVVALRRRDGVLECMHHTDLVRAGQRAVVLASHGIDLDESPLTALRYAFATVIDGAIAVLGNSEPLKDALWDTLTTYGAVIRKISDAEFEIIFTKLDD